MGKADLEEGVTVFRKAEGKPDETRTKDDTQRRCFGGKDLYETG